MRKKKLTAAAILAIALLYVFMISSYAYSLNSGSVHGLPEKLVVLDDEGHSVSENGSYYYSVTDMKPKVTYVKNIQIMNLRDDKSYKIYFSAESVSNTGEINLEDECECVITLDENEIYRGKVSGEGTPDMQKKPLDLGTYAPNEYSQMTVSVIWDGTSAGNFIDNGERIVTASGTEIVRGKSGETFISGETEFKWIFSAEVETDEDVTSTSSSESSSTVSSEVSSGKASSTVSSEISSNGSSSTSSNSSTNSSSNSQSGDSSYEVFSHSSQNSSYTSSTSSMSEETTSRPASSSVSKPSSESSKPSSSVTIESFVQTGGAVAFFAIASILVASLVLIAMTIKRKQEE